MPNIKSAKKRVLVNNKKTEQNKNIRTAVKTEIKKIELLIKENKLEEANKMLPTAFEMIDSACSKNIFHANNAAHKKAKLAKKLAAATKTADKVETPVAVKEEVKEEAPIKEEAPAPAKKTAAKKPAVKKTTAKKSAE